MMLLPQSGMTHMAASMVRQVPVCMQSEPLRRFRSGSLGLSGAVNLVWGQRMLSTLILIWEQDEMYSAVVGT
jgi:hypothetical protein